ncbi:hypothetical protein L3N51_00952 [Metallosphaera sp. J1]|nr:hypothetical protein [Metallosphaera javensis (ex Hofmann et al. 2022)]BCS91644.1 MAG: hypothetical protein MjAS7_0252 [Metallosphaera javensis (ex Sakai et al. 2022)]
MAKRKDINSSFKEFIFKKRKHVLGSLILRCVLLL